MRKFQLVLVCLSSVYLLACGGEGGDSASPSAAVEVESYQLDWEMPDTRVDGSALMAQDVAGYRVRWTNQTTGATGEIAVAGTETGWQFDLPVGEYQFEIASEDSNGRLSEYVTAN